MFLLNMAKIIYFDNYANKKLRLRLRLKLRLVTWAVFRTTGGDQKYAEDD